MNPAEKIGRSVFGSRLAKRARRPRPIPEAFLVRLNDDRISVDRMDRASTAELATLAVARGKERAVGGKTFHGWATLTVANAESSGRTVRASPVDSNPYHADIHLNLPDDTSDDRERRVLQKQHSVELAACATWQDAPVTEIPEDDKEYGKRSANRGDDPPNG